MQKLFLSFTGLLRLISTNEVTDDDLETGLFMFGCTRSHALDPGAGGPGVADERTWNDGKFAAAHPTLLRVLRTAELAGRVVWVKGESGQRQDPYEALSHMLERHGLPPVVRDPEGDGGWFYSYPGVTKAIEKTGMPLQPMY